METQFLQRISALPPSTPACTPDTLQCRLATSPVVPNARVQRKRLSAVWLKPAPGSTWSRDHYELPRKQLRLPHSSPHCGAKEAHSGTASKFPGDFLYKIAICISRKISCPRTNQAQHR